MCELALVNPSDMDVMVQEEENEDEDDDSVADWVEYIYSMYQQNPHGLGLVAIHTDGESFSYEREIFGGKDESEMVNIINDTIDFFYDNENAWRVAIHARLATCGEVCEKTAHPIDVDCPKTDIDFVMHNGVVNQHQKRKKRMEDRGHEFKTEVDSELIPHDHGSIPDSIEDVEGTSLTGTLNYLLFTDERILVRSTSRYRDDSESFRMARKRKREYLKGEDGVDFTSRWMLAKPDRTVETESITRYSYSSRKNFRGTKHGRGGRTIGYGSSYSKKRLGDYEEDEEVGIEELDEEEKLAAVGTALTEEEDEMPDWWGWWSPEYERGREESVESGVEKGHATAWEGY